PSPYGTGELGPGAFSFVDFLYESGQKLWQVLPVNPTGYGDSPYQSPSSFAGNFLLISPDLMVKQGYLNEDDLIFPEGLDFYKADFNAAKECKDVIFRKAFSGFDINDKKYIHFCRKNKVWLEDYTLFSALKSYFIKERKDNYNPDEHSRYVSDMEGVLDKNTADDYYFGGVWFSWPDLIRNRDKNAILSYSVLLKDDINYQKFLQYIFYTQWADLKAYANSKNISVIGDMPIFVSADSADMWANHKLFLTDTYGATDYVLPSFVAGVPPDYFSDTGQLWGNPLYDWEAHKKDGYNWWITRFKAMLNVFDIIRIDHFRGFESFWQVPRDEKTAVNGKWVKGPGYLFFKAIEKELGQLPVIAEDLGIITESVTKLRCRLKYPGMKILQFAFDSDSNNAYLPHNFKDSNCCVYTGTHDNDTTLGWFLSSDENVRDYVRRYLNISGEDIAWDFIRLANGSSADIMITPIQDILSLNGDFRMNTPGTSENNWLFRFKDGDLTSDMANGLKYFNSLFNR
ncbi:MAG: 4-alpha-glucanotransferase, partial [Clostridiales bacterium]|nr:4-alpha-glucanotransferase [Clostridiales bacterium]